MGYIGFTQDHHCIPKQHRHHELLKKIDYDINWGVKMTRVWNEIFQDKGDLWTLDSGHYDV